MLSVAGMSGVDDAANHLLDGLVNRAVQEWKILVSYNLTFKYPAVLVTSLNPASAIGFAELD